MKTLALLALVTISRIVAGNEVCQVRLGEGIGTQSKIRVGTQVIDPEPTGLRIGTGRALIEEEYIRLDALDIENIRRQAQQGIYVTGLQEVASDGFTRATLEQEAIGQTIELAYVDRGYTGTATAETAKAQELQLEAVKLPEAKRGFVLLPYYSAT